VVETRTMLAWLRDHEADLEPADYDAADSISGAIREYQVPAYIVEGENDSLLRSIFDRVNSAGKPIGRAEIFHALFAGETEPGSPATVVSSLERLGFGTIDPDRVVQSLLALRGGNVQRDLHDEFGSGEAAGTWYEKTDQALTRAIKFLRTQGVPHLMMMPSTLPLPILAAFFHLHPQPAQWTRRLLARWLWRGWVHGFGRQGQTPALRQAIQIVNPRKAAPDLAPDELDAALGLLATVPDEEAPRTRLRPFRTESAAGRLALIALASLRPLDLNSKRIDLAAQFEEVGMAAVTDMVRERRGNLGARGFWPRRAGGPTGREESSILVSHAINGTAADLLIARDVQGFLEVRGAAIEALTTRFVAARVEAKALTRRSLISLVVADMEEASNGS
jgi:hypothetical protein